MTRQTKRIKAWTGDRLAAYPVGDAIRLVKENAKAKFDESIEIAVNLGVDPRHADQQVRGVVNLPSGTGRETVGSITRTQLREIAVKKMKDLNANDIDAAARIIEGSAKAIGLNIVER